MSRHCEMRGFLTFLVLRLLSGKEMSGEEIRQELAQRKGCRPSAGTVYPVLKGLRESGFIEETSQGHKVKRYRLTPEGRREVRLATKKFIQLFYDCKDEFRDC